MIHELIEDDQEVRNTLLEPLQDDQSPRHRRGPSSPTARRCTCSEALLHPRVVRHYSSGGSGRRPARRNRGAAALRDRGDARFDRVVVITAPRRCARRGARRFLATATTRLIDDKEKTERSDFAT